MFAVLSGHPCAVGTHQIPATPNAAYSAALILSRVALRLQHGSASHGVWLWRTHDSDCWHRPLTSCTRIWQSVSRGDCAGVHVAPPRSIVLKTWQRYMVNDSANSARYLQTDVPASHIVKTVRRLLAEVNTVSIATESQLSLLDGLCENCRPTCDWRLIGVPATNSSSQKQYWNCLGSSAWGSLNWFTRHVAVNGNLRQICRSV
jgi:hypothetical protein